MSTANQLRWQLLIEEMSEIIVKKLKRQEIPPLSTKKGIYEKQYLWTITPLSNLFMSGKEGAEAVQMILHPGVSLIERVGNKYDIKIKFNGCEGYIQPAYFKKLAIQWARFIDLHDRAYNDTDVMPEYIFTLQNHNSVEELRFHGYSICSDASVAVINACPNLSLLISGQTFLSLLLKRKDVNSVLMQTLDVNLTSIRSLQIENLELDDDDDDGVKEFKSIIWSLAKFPQRFPFLETLTISSIDGVFEMPKGMSSRIRTVKSLEFKVSSTRHPHDDFLNVAAFTKLFPNIESTCLTLDAKFDPRKFSKSATMDPVQAFKDIDCSFNFKFNYNLEFFQNFSLSTAKKNFHNKLNALMRECKMDDSVARKDQWVTYSATKSYPNRTMEFKLRAWAGVAPRKRKNPAT